MKDKRPDSKVKYMPISKYEKEGLEKRIFESISSYRSRKRKLRFIIGMAASIVLLSGAGLYLYKASVHPPSIIDYVNSNNRAHQQNSDRVTLIYGEEDELKIDEKTNEIHYSNSGQDITVGAAKTINQKVVESNEDIVYNTLLVPYGKRLKTELSDGSLVWLNSGSKMVYPAVFNGNKREVYIEGEAIFDVAHNESKPFYVISENQQIKVLGTVFGVTNYSDENTISTILESGSVEISYRNNSNVPGFMDRLKITPGTKASYNKRNKSIVSEKVDVGSYFSWREGFLVFKNNDLRYIIKRISRYYNVKITVIDEVVDNGTFSGYLNLNEDIDKVMESIKESANVDYEFMENEIIID